MPELTWKPGRTVLGLCVMGALAGSALGAAAFGAKHHKQIIAKFWPGKKADDSKDEEKAKGPTIIPS